MTSSSGSPPARASKWFGRLLLGAVLVAMFLSVPAQGVLAQTSKDIGILVVDMQRIQRDSSAAISVREQTAAMRTNLEKTIAERAREISSEEAELAELRQRLTTDEFRARVRSFEEKVFANRDFAQRESSKLQSLLAQASTRLRREIAPILAQLLREREAQLMLDSSQVILNAETLDVTDEVIQRLDEAMPTMILAPVPAPE